jgi:hypothetical protein
MAIILKANKVNLFVSSVLFVFWYHSPNFLDTPRKCVPTDSLSCASNSYGSDEFKASSDTEVTGEWPLQQSVSRCV